MHCRHCKSAIDPLRDVFVDLGTAPPSNAFLEAGDLARAETYLPLKTLTCPVCRLVQVEETERPDVLFGKDYVYFSSYSSSWLAHARRYVERVVDRLALGPRSSVVEVASNDGYLLQYVRQRGIPCVGIEPTASTARAARARGIEVVEQFLGRATAAPYVATHGLADLVLANNVLAHVPEIDDFVAGLRTLLAPSGCLTLEFPHLLRLVENGQFDTIYHEHYSYLSLHTVARILQAHGLVVWDVEELPTHGGSLRVWAQHADHARGPEASVAKLLALEVAAGMLGDDFYRHMQRRAEAVKDNLLRFLLDCKRDGSTVLAYGAAAKGNTLLNFAGVKPDLLPAVGDASPHKQGRFLPGSRIPVITPEALLARRPDIVLVLPWNLRDEVIAQFADARAWGARFATAVPSLELF